MIDIFNRNNELVKRIPKLEKSGICSPQRVDATDALKKLIKSGAIQLSIPPPKFEIKCNLKVD